MSVSLKSIFIPLALALFFSLPAHAEQDGKGLKEKLSNNLVITSSVKGCDADIKEHCDGLGANTQKVFMCLSAYEEQLSEQCKSGILEAAITLRNTAAVLDYSIRACEADADKHCLNVQPGEGRIVNCIKANESNVSAACVSALKKTGLWKMTK